MDRLRKAYYILRYLGPRVVWLRAGVYLGRAVGLSRRRFPHTPWDSIDLASICLPGTPTTPDEYAAFKAAAPPPFLFPLGRPPRTNERIGPANGERTPSLAERLTLLRENRCVYFFRMPSPEPIDWYHNPFDDMRSEPGIPWYQIPDYLPTQGDPRTLWEPARAAWAIDCARAKAAELANDADSLMWRWIDSWMDACPPFMGVHWKCGQESSVRFIAIALGFWALAGESATTPARWVQFARLAWATGHRIFNQINYAVSQKNNHAMSEACGLLLISHLFPEFRESRLWFEKGRHVLLNEVRRQVYPDGSYLQQSMNYERVMLDGSILGARIAELAGRPMPADFTRTLGRCAEFLYELMDERTGRMPQYGPNDGAHILPLTECDFNDFRPVVQAAHYLATGKRLLPSGPWDEQLLWLFGEDMVSSQHTQPPPPTSRAFESGGYYTLRNDDSWAMVRCHAYRDRPTQCDPLQLDLWWRGLNIFQDCGTYHYYCPGRKDLEYYFKSIAAHNTPEVDGQDPLELVSRFLWFPWPKANRIRHEQFADGVACFEGISYAYARKPWRVAHRRLVLGVPGDAWVIVDELTSRGKHRALLRWHMIEASYSVDTASQSVRLDLGEGPLHISVSAGQDQAERFEVIRARNEPGRVQGIASPYYSEMQPSPTIEAAFNFTGRTRIFTVVQPGNAAAVRLVEAQAESERWDVDTSSGKITLALRPSTANGSILDGVKLVASDR